LETGEPSQHSLIDTGKPRKTCVEVAGRRTFRILTSSQQSKRSYIPILTIGCQSRYLPSVHNVQLQATEIRHLRKMEEKKYKREIKESNDEKGIRDNSRQKEDRISTVVMVWASCKNWG